MRQRMLSILAGLVWISAIGGSSLFAADAVVRIPEDLKVTQAAAKAGESSLPGVIEPAAIRFADLKAKTAYDIHLTLSDGRRLIGVNMGWYTVTPADAGKDPFTEEDRKEIEGICTVSSFYNKCQIVLLKGDKDRVTALMQLLRDSDFHAGQNEVIWRAELWYFQFQNGGWEKVSQQNKVLDRKRFQTRQEVRDYVTACRFVPRLGGLFAKRDADKLTVELAKDDIQKAIEMPVAK